MTRGGKIRRNSQTQSVADMLSEMMKQQFALEIDLNDFDGNPLKFHYFMAVFREAVKKKAEDPCGRLTRLINNR